MGVGGQGVRAFLSDSNLAVCVSGPRERPQHRVAKRFPRPVGAEEFGRPFEQSMQVWWGWAEGLLPRLHEALERRVALEVSEERVVAERCSVSHPVRVRLAQQSYGVVQIAELGGDARAKPGWPS